MKIGIMQPYFFPYIGYFQLIANTDKWVFFDEVQYNKRSWMNRNRILHPAKKDGYQYISVPVKKHEKGTLIKDVVINDEINWKQEILGKLTVYKMMKAEYYDGTIELLKAIFDHPATSFLELSILSTSMICEYLGMEFACDTASNINFDRSIIQGPGDWALSITKKLGGDVYINPPGGAGIFDEDKYRQHGIRLLFLKANLSSYRQSQREAFVPGLSIVDLLMFNGPARTREMVNTDFAFCTKEQLMKEDA